MTIIEHSDMSRRVREYFQVRENSRKNRTLQVADIATMTDAEFIAEKMNDAEARWTESYRRQDYRTPDHKDMDLDACKYSFDFWKQIATLKGLGQ